MQSEIPPNQKNKERCSDQEDVISPLPNKRTQQNQKSGCGQGVSKYSTPINSDEVTFNSKNLINKCMSAQGGQMNFLTQMPFFLHSPLNFDAKTNS